MESDKKNSIIIKEIIKALYNNMKTYDIVINNIDLISRKTLCDMSESNYEYIFEIGINELEKLMKDNSENVSFQCDNILNITELFKEIIKKNNIKFNTFL